MKAERRHDLKTNTLARGIEEIPNHWRDYGSKLLLVVVVALTVFLVVRYWNDKKQRDAEALDTARQTIQGELQKLEVLPFEYSSNSPSALVEKRQEAAQKADQAISTLLGSSSAPADIANANLARGDLNWKLANLPDVPGVATQPALQIQNRDGLLEQARAAYEKVLNTESSASPGNVFYARLGLAAIAENQGQWDKAKDQYQAVAGASNMPASFKDYAREQLTQLPKYQTPALIVPAPPVLPTTHATPETFGPMPLPTPSVGTTNPATAPSTGAAPTTVPVGAAPTTQP